MFVHDFTVEWLWLFTYRSDSTHPPVAYLEKGFNLIGCQWISIHTSRAAGRMTHEPILQLLIPTSDLNVFLKVVPK